MNFIFTDGRMDCKSEEGLPMGYITFPQVSDTLVEIDRVFTAPAFRGQGLAGQMMQALLDYLDQQGKRVRLSCPYSRSYVEKHPEYRRLVEE